MYGAKFDGTTDDLAAWNACILAAKATGSYIFHSSGTSFVSAPPSILSGVSIFGCGESSVLSCSDANGSVIKAGEALTGNVFGNLNWKCTTATGGGDSSGMFLNGTFSSTHYNMFDVLFDNIYFNQTSNCNTNGVKIFLAEGNNVTCAGLRFRNCKFINIRRMGLEIFDGNADTTVRMTDLLIEGCEYSNIGGGTFGYGASVSCNAVGVRVANNDFDTLVGTNIEIVSPVNFTITGNTMRNASSVGILVSKGNMQATPAHGVISGNTFNGNDTNYGIHIFNGSKIKLIGNDVTGGNIYVQNSVGCSDAGNTITTILNLAMVYDGCTVGTSTGCTIDTTGNTAGTLFSGFRLLNSTSVFVSGAKINYGTSGVAYDFSGTCTGSIFSMIRNEGNSAGPFLDVGVDYSTSHTIRFSLPTASTGVPTGGLWANSSVATQV